MWEPCAIEQRVEAKLLHDPGGNAGKELFSSYVEARRLIVDDVLPYIKAVEPHLTDHGPLHVAHVLNNVDHLLGNGLDQLSSYDQYILLMSVLFHDVGNIHGREGHENRVMGVYDHVRPKAASSRSEKLLLARIVAAHSGKAKDGTSDTLKDLSGPHSFRGKPIRAQDIAAIMRFADECAEGRQRTSLYMRQVGFPKRSRIYHAYANVTEVAIDPQNERVALTYHIDLNEFGRVERTLSKRSERELKQLLTFIYRRVIKLDVERKYAKHYCSLLEPLKRTTVATTFWSDSRPLAVSLPELVLSDLVVPGQEDRELESLFPDYAVTKVIAKVRSSTKKGAAE